MIADSKLQEVQDRLNAILSGNLPEPISMEGIDSDIGPLAAEVNRLVEVLRELSGFILPLSVGDLSVVPPRTRNFLAAPFKNLHASLRHLTWQANQVAQGDFSQRVDFMGEFSTAFNHMVEELASQRSQLERQNALLEAQKQILEAKNEELYVLATTDLLTGQANRRHFMISAQEALHRDLRHGRALPFLMLDIDHFKRVNDTWGHAAGDTVIRTVAARCRQVLRTYDIFGRLDGEEFGAILPETGADEALVVAERMRLAVCDMPIPWEQAFILCTVSIGLAFAEAGEIEPDFPLHRADEALYRAKEAGRNRVVVAPGRLS